MALSIEKIKDLLVQEKVIKAEEIEETEMEAKRIGVTLTRYLIAQGRLTQRKFNEIVSTFLNIPVYDIKTHPLDPAIVEILPEAIARQRQVLIVGANPEKKEYTVVMTDPTDINNINFLTEYLDATIDIYLITPEDLRFGFRIYKKKSAAEFEKLIRERVKEASNTIKETGGAVLENIPLVQLFDTLLDYAAILEASDVFFQPEEELLKIRFRVDGLLRDIFLTDKTINDGIVARAKTLAGLRIDEHRKSQDGRFRFQSSDINLDIRVAIMPTFFGEKTTLRLLSGSQSFLTFEELGVGPKTAEQLYKASKRPFGMLLSAGPTGSGKTTTIYSIITLLNRPEVHITSIEDPIEYLIPNVSQTQVNTQAEITFASGLRALLRHSPDIILIGEIRDPETSGIAIDAALTGHLLISTIHTNNAVSAVIRLLDLDVPAFLIASTLNGVLAQRLVRKICPNCMEPFTPTPTMLEGIEKEFEKIGKKGSAPKKMFIGKGCTVCDHTGYKGRSGIFEFFLVDEKVRNVISGANVTDSSLKEVAREEGMIFMFEDGLQKVQDGVTTLEEVFRVISQ